MKRQGSGGAAVLLGLLFSALSSVEYTSAQDLTCKVPSDVVFVLDGSDSLTSYNFQKMKQFVANLVASFEVDSGYTRVGVIVFGTFVEDVIDLGNITTVSALTVNIYRLPHPQSGTGTSKALERMREMFRISSRVNSKHVGIVITDGRSVSPKKTQEQAELAKQENIEMISIGFGDSVFRDELAFIASSQQNVLTSNDFDDLLQKTSGYLRSRVCEPITTPPPVTSTMRPIVTGTGELCPNCIKGRDWGYKSFPGDCGKYIEMEPDSQGNRLEFTRSCAFGMFWSLYDLTCKIAGSVPCDSNPCRGRITGKVAMNRLCNSYWQCFNEKPVGNCCPLGYRFAGSDCVLDATCVDVCPPKESDRIKDPVDCTLFTDPTNPAMYRERVMGERNIFTEITRNCPPGTEFVQLDCGCSKLVTRLPSLPLDECKPEVDFDFNVNFHDSSRNDIPVGLEFVTIDNGQALFMGNGMINMWRFSNTDFRTKLTMMFDFQIESAGTINQTLVTNCIFSDTEEATISIMADRSTSQVYFKTVTTDGMVEFAVNYSFGTMNRVIYVYDGVHCTGVVNSVPQRRALTGHILRRQSGIVLGSGTMLQNNFFGRMDNFKLYMCFPSEVAQYV